MPTSPTPISAAPTTPDRSNRSAFPAQMYAFFSYIKDTFVAGINAIATNAYDNAVESASSASTATTKAGEAASSAANASASEDAAYASQQAAASLASSAAASYDAFDDRYLGSKATPPTLDNDGNALITGALYWDSVSAAMKAWNGAAWVVAYSPSAGDIPSISGQTGKFLSNNGSVPVWASAPGVRGKLLFAMGA